MRWSCVELRKGTQLDGALTGWLQEKGENLPASAGECQIGLRRNFVLIVFDDLWHHEPNTMLCFAVVLH